MHEINIISYNLSACLNFFILRFRILNKKAKKADDYFGTKVIDPIYSSKEEGRKEKRESLDLVRIGFGSNFIRNAREDGNFIPTCQVVIKARSTIRKIKVWSR